MLPLLVLATFKAPPTHYGIVFSATRFAHTKGHNRQVAGRSLYYINGNLTGLRRLTFGDGDVFPTTAADGKHLYFWREEDVPYYPPGHPKPNYQLLRITYRLRRCNPDGSRIRDEHFETEITPSIGLVRAIERFGSPAVTAFLKKHAPANVDYSFNGKLFNDYDWPVFSPDGQYAISGPLARIGIVSISTGSQVHLNNVNRDEDFGWMDNKRSVSGLFSVSARVTTYSLNGSVQRQAGFRQPTMNEADESIFTDNNLIEHPYLVHPLGNTGKALVTARRFVSRASHDFITLVDLRRKSWKYLAGQTLEGVSPDGRKFIGSDYEGAYGPIYHCTTFLWDAETLKSRKFGFRYMTCKGACFVPLLRRAR